MEENTSNKELAEYGRIILLAYNNLHNDDRIFRIGLIENGLSEEDADNTVKLARSLHKVQASQCHYL